MPQQVELTSQISTNSWMGMGDYISAGISPIVLYDFKVFEGINSDVMSYFP